jgi:hypothetical protein
VAAEVAGSQEPEGVKAHGSLLKSETNTSSEYMTCTEANASMQAQQGVDSRSHAYLSAQSLGSTITAFPSEDQASVPSEFSSSTGQFPAIERPPNASGRLQATSQAPPRPPDPLKFNNLLDKCDAASDSDVVKPKPRPVVQPAFPEPSQFISPGVPPADHVQQGVSQVTTTTTSVPISTSPVKLESLREDTSSPEVSLSPQDGMNDKLGPLQPFLFPVSNSPVDLMTMLSRLAAFTGELLTVLTPTIKSSLTRGNGKVRCIEDP